MAHLGSSIWEHLGIRHEESKEANLMNSSHVGNPPASSLNVDVGLQCVCGIQSARGLSVPLLADSALSDVVDKILQ